MESQNVVTIFRIPPLAKKQEKTAECIAKTVHSETKNKGVRQLAIKVNLDEVAEFLEGEVQKAEESPPPADHRFPGVLSEKDALLRLLQAVKRCLGLIENEEGRKISEKYRQQ